MQTGGAGRSGTVAAIESAASRAKTSASSNPLEARRLPPCSPVEAASPQTHSPGSEDRPA